MSYVDLNVKNVHHTSTHLKEKPNDTTKVQMFLDLLRHPASFWGASEFSLPWGFMSLNLPSMNQMLAVSSDMYRQATRINFEKTISSFSCLKDVQRSQIKNEIGRRNFATTHVVPFCHWNCWKSAVGKFASYNAVVYVLHAGSTWHFRRQRWRNADQPLFQLPQNV